MAGYDSAMTPSVGYRPSGRSLSGVSTTAATFGAGVADAMSKGTNQIQNSIEVMVRQQEQDDKRAAATAYNRAVAELGVVEEQYSLTQGDQAGKQKQSAIEAKGAVREKYVKDLTPDQARYFDEDFGNFAIRYDGRINTHAVKQQTALDIANAEGRVILNAQEASRSYGDPYKLAELHAEQTRSLAAIASQKGLPAGSDAEKGYVAEQMTKYHSSVFRSIMATENYGAAQQYVAAYGHEMNPADRDSLMKELRDAQEAEAPFALSDQFFDPNVDEYTAAQKLREKFEAGGIDSKVYRAARADLNARYSELDGKRRLEANRNEQMFRGSDDLKKAIAANPQAWASLDPQTQQQVISAKSTKAAPYTEQLQVMEEQRNLFEKSPQQFEAQFFKEELVDGVVQRTRIYPDWLNGLSKENADEILEKLNTSMLGASGNNYPTGEAPIAQLSSAISDDFKDLPRERTFVESELRKWGDRYKAENGFYPPLEESWKKYDLLKSKASSETGQKGIVATVTGRYTLDNIKPLESRYGDELKKRGSDILIEQGFTRKEATVAMSLAMKDREVASRVMLAYLNDPLEFRRIMRAIAAEEPVEGDTVQAQRDRQGIEDAKLKGRIDYAVGLSDDPDTPRQPSRPVYDPAHTFSSGYR